MTSDLNRFLTPGYPPGTNLPKEIIHPQGFIRNYYTADGEKTGKKLFTPLGILLYHEQYFGDLVVKNGQPSRILHPDGVINLSSRGVEFTYHLKDHLGNVRVVITPGENNQPEVLQMNDYYPFGMVHTTDAGANKYLYNDKEEQEMPGKWLDYGARFYDVQLGRWHVIDPMIEKHYEWTGYAYVYNNPIKFIDPFGLDTLLADNYGRFSETRLPDPDNENDVIVRVSSREREKGEINYNKSGELRRRHKTKEVEKNSIAVRPNKDKEGNIISTVISPKDIETGLKVFKWLADNTSVEYSYIRVEGMPTPTITTNHERDKESLGATYAVQLADQGVRVIHVHNHPYGCVEASPADKAFYERIGKFGVVLGIYSKNEYKSYQENEYP